MCNNRHVQSKNDRALKASSNCKCGRASITPKNVDVDVERASFLVASLRQLDHGCKQIALNRILHVGSSRVAHDPAIYLHLTMHRSVHSPLLASGKILPLMSVVLS